MELQTESPAAQAEGLVGKGIAGRQQLGPIGQFEPFPVPMIDVEVGGEERLPGVRRPQRVVADLVDTGGMARDARAECPGQQLTAEADAEIAAAAGDVVADPIDLVLYIGRGRTVVGALGAAEDDRARIGAGIVGQPIALGRTAPLDRIPLACSMGATRASRHSLWVTNRMVPLIAGLPDDASEPVCPRALSPSVFMIREEE